MHDEEPIKKERLGTIDLMWSLGYLISMFFSGRLSDRYNPKRLLSLGLLVVALAQYSLTILKETSVANVYTYSVAQFVNAICQAVCFTCSVAIISHWSMRATLVMSIIFLTSVHTGNIEGYIIGTVAIDKYDIDWKYMFVIPGSFICCMNGLILLFVRQGPESQNKASLELPKSPEKEEICTDSPINNKEREENSKEEKKPAIKTESEKKGF